MSEVNKVYWDSSCFLSLLNPDEKERATICEDVLHNGELGNVLIYTSMWTVVEVIRPRRPGSEALPVWAMEALESIKQNHPNAHLELEMLWRRYQSDTSLPKLTPKQIEQIHSMFFGWKWLKLVRIDQRVATRAVELARDHNLKPADSVHVASALIAKTPALQAWDRDFQKISHLITVEEPKYMTIEGPLITATLQPKEPTSIEGVQNEQKTIEPVTADIRGSVESDVTDQARAARAETENESDDEDGEN